MEGLHKELEEMRSAMEKLTEEHRAKSALSESLRRAHDEQSGRLQEAKKEIEKQSKEIDAKAEEIALATQMYEELKSNFCQKELALKQLSAANENLKGSLREKSAGWEERNKELVSSLEEANARKEEQEQASRVYQEEIEKLKCLLSLSQKKCSEVEKRAQASRELNRRDELLAELELEKGKAEDRLKWKSEQFRHLEEAHNKAQDEFREAKKGWDRERSNLFDEINTLQVNLDSQTRVAEDLRSQLQMCNQALAHEESRRKFLEIKISESKAMYENVTAEYEETRSQIGMLTARRDEEIADLRNLLATKVTHLKEAEYSKTHLELENQELRRSVKELQESLINGVDAATSLKNLRHKYRLLEQAHRDCLGKLKAREDEWISQTEKLQESLDGCLVKLDSKDEYIWELQVELEDSYSSLMQQKLENEEIWIVCIILEAKFMESCTFLEKTSHDSDHYAAKAEKTIAFLMEEVEKKSSAVSEAQAEITKEKDTVASLQARIDHPESIGQKLCLMQKEFDDLTRVFQAANGDLGHSREQASLDAADLQNNLQESSDALDQAEFALAGKTSELHKVKSELQHLRTAVEQMEKLRSDLETELAMCHSENKELKRCVEVYSLASMEAEKTLIEEKETSLLLMKEKDNVIKELQQRLALLENDFARIEFEAASLAKREMEKQNKKLLQIAEYVDIIVNGVRTKLDLLEQKYEFTVSEAFMNLDHVVEQIQSLEGEFRFTGTTLMLRLEEKQAEIETVYEALEKIITAHVLDKLEIEYKNIAINDLEGNIETLELKLLHEQKQSLNMSAYLDWLKAEKTMGRLEREKEKAQAESELERMMSSKRNLEGQIAELIDERKELVRLLVGLSDLIGEVFQKDKELMRNWERVLGKKLCDDKAATNFEGQDFFNCHKVEERSCISPSRNKTGQNSSKRSPLKVQNC